ncbi:hypothetical protein VN97_g3812 [Penicillium thymicola]|uniref:Uncharacterized protein n=1 Tax=Penicillium thymicola TaxID=293382 RepID=A0AAI9TLB9_PENTH|nr:hypothetical protein VN97_g3812 [Penicillium thymicola]
MDLQGLDSGVSQATWAKLVSWEEALPRRIYLNHYNNNIPMNMLVSNEVMSLEKRKGEDSMRKVRATKYATRHITLLLVHIASSNLDPQMLKDA